MTKFTQPLQSLGLAFAKGDINQSLVISGGSTLGAGIWKWPDWKKRVEAGAEGAAASATRVVLNGLFVERKIQDRAQNEARMFLEGGSQRRAITLVGRHGTGRSVVGMSVAHALAKDGFDEIYVVDDYSRFSQTDLRNVLPPDQRCLVVVDDADIQAASRPFFNSVGSVDTCGLATFANRRAANAFAALDRDSEVLEVPDRPTPDELQLLRNRMAEHRLGRRNASRLNWMSIRTACRILSGEPPPKELAQALVNLRLEPGSVGRTFSILSLCGARGIELPLTLLARTIDQQRLPEEVYPWLQSRPVFVEGGGEAKTVWIEDRDVLRLAERRISGEVNTISTTNTSTGRKFAQRLST